MSDASIGDDGRGDVGMDGSGGTEVGEAGDDGVSATGTDDGDGGDASESTDGGPPTDADSSSDDTVQCELSPVPEDLIEQVAVASNILRKVAVGDTQPMVIGSIIGGGGAPLEPLLACVQWSVAPADQATIDDTGLLMVAADATPGTVLTVTADIEDGRRIIEHEVEVYEPVDAPLLGTWSEVGRLECGTLAALPADPSPIGEVVFFDTGDFWVTWTPFETYVDYRGTFVYDETTDELTMTIASANYEPSDTDLAGTATLSMAGDELELSDMWFGSPRRGPITAQCGHVLE